MRRAAAGLLALALVWPAACRRSPEARAAARLETLREVLQARNDNDPRLDRDFDGLSAGAKRLFREEYRRTPPEKRNQRGTIVYLLGRNLRSEEDWAFLREVAAEPPCLSLLDCSKKAAPGGHAASLGDEVTLAYPSLVALRQAQRALESRGPGSAARAMEVIRAGKASKSPAVSRMAVRILKGIAPGGAAG